MADDARTLQIFRDGRRYEGDTQLRLPVGSQGNLITLYEMRKIVREDAQLDDLRNFAMREIVGLDKPTLAEQIDAAFRFCRDAIAYREEGLTTETVADLWSCMYVLDAKQPVGDCAVKSVALATVLSYLGLRPYFVAIRQVPNVEWFNHVYVGLPGTGLEIPLDPTPENFRPGDELGYIELWRIPIFD